MVCACMAMGNPSCFFCVSTPRTTWYAIESAKSRASHRVHRHLGSGTRPCFGVRRLRRSLHRPAGETRCAPRGVACPSAGRCPSRSRSRVTLVPSSATRLDSTRDVGLDALAPGSSARSACSSASSSACSPAPPGRSRIVCTEPFAERRRADDRRAVVVLQRARDELGRAGAVLVHEHHHRQRRERAALRAP